MKVITVPENIDVPGFRVFLAGAIDMGEADYWQEDVIFELQDYDGLVLINPRRDQFTEDTLDEQILWELDALHAVDQILMWFPKNAKAPVSFFESGLFMSSGKLSIGAELGFYRRRNLELTCKYYGVPLWQTLDGVTAGAVHRLVNPDSVLPN